MSLDHNDDLEKKHPIVDENNNIIAGESFAHGDGTIAKLHRLAIKYGVEARGIERVPENERHDNSLANVGTMWLSANMVISSVAIGVLGPQLFYMSFTDSCLTILFFNLLSTLPVCFYSTFGPVFGLRQMVLSRYYFGFYGVKIIAFLNCLACLGWSAVNVIVGAQLISTVNHHVDSWAGIIIIAACTFIITLFGYKVVHSYEKWSWIPVTVIFLIVVGEFAKDGAFNRTPMSSGRAEAASVLSFGGAIFGFGVGWTSYAADYTVYQPPTQSRKKVFLSTWLGLIFPLLFTEMLGAALYLGTTGDKPINQLYADGYTANKVGGLLGAVLVGNLGNFGNFCLVILALSIIANNCPNIYSIGLSVQLFSRHLQVVPRFIWTGVGTIIYVIIAIPGAKHFETVLENFMLLIGYWLAIYAAISLSEHFFFRRGFAGYNVHDYETPSKLPVGLAAIFSFCVGIAGAVLGMAGAWYQGPIALAIIKPFGGDVGFELAFAFAAIAYCVTRPIEKNYFKR